MRSDGLSAAD
jgi:hypothetical protein